ncbi:MAG: ABC transporter substrate-binding protein [Trueperaceae bacterium]
MPTLGSRACWGGEYDFADALNTESLSRLENSGVVTPMIVRPFAFPVMIINVASGALTDPEVRRAVQASFDHESMLLAGLGGPEFYELNGSYYPEGSPYYSTAGTEQYNTFDVEAAREILAGSPYDGEPIRILSSQQYEFLYRMSIVAAENLRAAGFNVDLQVVEWATLTERRADPGAWEAYWTFGNFNPEPTSYSFLVGPGHGQWSPEEKEQILRDLNAARTTQERAELWSRLQALLYEQVPVIKIGDMFGLAGVSSDVELGDSHIQLPIPYFWNIGIE